MAETIRHEAESHGARRRVQILSAATDLASSDGLSGLSLARLADQLGMSKSGVFAHFGSKQELQLAAIEAASREFEAAVIRATEAAEPGLDRLRALVEAWIQHVETTSRRGGCFFFAVSAEFASQPGAVRDQLSERTRAWLRLLEREARTALRTREIGGESAGDPEQLAFRLHAYVQEANWMRQLHEDDRAFERAREATRSTLEAAIRPTTELAPIKETTHD